MARAPKRLTQKKTNKPKPMSRRTVKTLADKYYGPEPIDITTKGYVEALNWYNYMHEQDQARDWFIEYLKLYEYPKNVVRGIERLPKYAIPTTVGWVSRILMNGNTVDTPYMANKIAELMLEVEKHKAPAEKVATERLTIREKSAAKADKLITDIEFELDHDDDFKVYDFLQGKEATPQAAMAVFAYYEPVLEELLSGDEQVKEAFGKSMKKETAFWVSFLDDCERFAGNQKAVKVRKPREKKVKSAVELTKTVKFQKEYNPLKIVSRNPAEIVGAQNVWLYNTKTRKISQYNAVGPAGLSIKGTTLIGYDVDTSTTKSVRKPEETVGALLAAGKIQLRKFMIELKTNQTAANGRLNSDTIILRVSK